MCGTKMYFPSFLKLNSHLKNFFVIRVSNCCSARVHRGQLENDAEERARSLFCSPGKA